MIQTMGNGGKVAIAQELIEAICQGDCQRAIALIPVPYQEMVIPDGSGLTPLHHAVQHNQYRVVIYLLAAGADPVVTSQDGIRPHALAKELGHTAIAEVIWRAIRCDD